MALFGPKTCDICGKSYKGLGHPCKDGNFCNECHEKVRIIIPDDDVYYTTVKEIKARLKSKAKDIEAKANAKMPDTCPVCGKKLSKFNSLELIDSRICMDCASKARDEMPGTTFDEIATMRLAKISAALNKTELKGGRTDSSGTFHSADNLRIAFPLIRTLVPIPGEDGFKNKYIDPLDSLSEEELKAASEKASAKREAVTAKYGVHKAIFEVDDIEKAYYTRKGISRQYRNEYRISGRILIGNITLGDIAEVKRRDCQKSFKVKGLGSYPFLTADKKELKEGSEGTIIAQGDISFVYPGDILFID